MKARHLGRYAEIGRLLLKHAHANVVGQDPLAAGDVVTTEVGIRDSSVIPRSRSCSSVSRPPPTVGSLSVSGCQISRSTDHDAEADRHRRVPSSRATHRSGSVRRLHLGILPRLRSSGQQIPRTREAAGFGARDTRSVCAHGGGHRADKDTGGTFRHAATVSAFRPLRSSQRSTWRH
jgi:hypothetical protein